MSPAVRERTRPDVLPESDDALRSIVRWLSWGSLLPVVGWVYGLALMWTSQRLPVRVKVIGSLLFPGGWFGAFVAAWFIAEQSSGYCYEATGGTVGALTSVTDSGCVQLGFLPGWLGLPLTVVVLVAAAMGPVYIQRGGRRVHPIGRT